MIKIEMLKNEYVDLISDFESSNFGSVAYSKEYILKILSNNHILKDNTNIFAITNNAELCGYIIFSITSDFTDIYKIFVRESDRYKGYGTMLIESIYSLAKRYKSKKIMIEVRKENKIAIKFYEKNNFKMISTRKSYYKDPIDDALIYEKVIE